MPTATHTCTNCDAMTEVRGRNVADAKRNAKRLGDLCEACQARAAAAAKADPAERLIALGGRRWTSDETGEERIYLNDVAQYADGVSFTISNSGRVEGVVVDGESMSNTKGSKFVGGLTAARVVLYVATGELIVENATDENAARILRGISA